MRSPSTLLPLLLCAASAAACSGGIPLPEEYQDTTYVKVKVTGASKDDLWWPDCDSKGNLTLRHWDGSGWKLAATVEGERCLTDSTTETNLVSGGPGVVWIGLNGFWRVGADGTVQDFSAATGGHGPVVLATADGKNLYAFLSNESGLSVVHLVDGVVQETLPAPTYSSLVATGPTDLWSDGDGGLLHLDGGTWKSYPGAPLAKTLGRHFPTGNLWALGFWHWDGSAWSGVAAEIPPLKDAGGMSSIGLVGDAQGSPVLVGLYSKSDQDGSGGFTGKYVFSRKQGDTWTKPETIGPWEQDACAGMGCGKMVFGWALDGTLFVSQHAAGGDTTIATFTP